MDEQYGVVKGALLSHVREIFQEIEDDVALSHEEKYALLEDALESASDVDELRVAFEQWHAEHAQELEMEYEVEDMWDTAITNAGVEEL